LELVKVEEVYQLKPGLVYVEGLRIEQADALNTAPPELPTQAFMDVALVRQENSVGVQWSVAWGENLTDYRDIAGIRHYLIPLAHLPDSASVVDLRDIEPISGPLVRQLAFRNGDYEELRARATTKEDVGLGKLPNAISDDPDSNSSDILASTAALNKLNQQISDALVGMVASFDMTTAPPGWLERNGANVSRTAYAKLFEVIGTRYGAGDGVTTFNIGDSRGVFIRGLDNGRGIDSGRELGNLQQGQNQSHTHTASSSAAGSHAHTGNTQVGGDHTHSGATGQAGNHSHKFNYINTPTNSDNPGIGAAMHWNTVGWQADHRITAAGDHAHSVTIEAVAGHTHKLDITEGGEHIHTITVDANGGNETRPINQALLVCIKY